MEKPKGHCTKWNKPNIEKKILYNFIYNFRKPNIQRERIKSGYGWGNRGQKIKGQYNITINKAQCKVFSNDFFMEDSQYQQWGMKSLKQSLAQGYSINKRQSPNPAAPKPQGSLRTATCLLFLLQNEDRKNELPNLVADYESR